MPFPSRPSFDGKKMTQMRNFLKAQAEKKKMFNAYKVVIGILLITLAIQFLTLGWTAGVGIIIRIDAPLKEKFDDGAQTDFSWISALTVGLAGIVILILHLIGRGAISKARKACSENDGKVAQDERSKARFIYVGALALAFSSLVLSAVMLILNIVWMNAAEEAFTTNTFTLNMVVGIILTATTLISTGLMGWIAYSTKMICMKDQAKLLQTDHHYHTELEEAQQQAYQMGHKEAEREEGDGPSANMKYHAGNNFYGNANMTHRGGY